MKFIQNRILCAGILAPYNELPNRILHKQGEENAKNIFGWSVNL